MLINDLKWPAVKELVMGCRRWGSAGNTSGVVVQGSSLNSGQK